MRSLPRIWGDIVLRVTDVSVSYGGIRAVRDVSIEVPTSGAVCLIGRNGAGKSSLVRAIAGWRRPDSGRVEFDGKDTTRMSASKVSRLGMVMVPEDRRVFGPLSVRENLLVPSQAGNNDVHKRMDYVLDLFPDLTTRLEQRAGSLSGGQQQMLAISRALMMSPRMLILDEPSLGLAPLVVEDVFEAIRRVVEAGQSVLLIEQNSRLALSTCGYGYVLSQGRIAEQGPAEDLMVHPNLAEMYL